MATHTLSEVYAQLRDRIDTVFVVPLINYDSKGTDYLYQLYAELIEAPNSPSIKSISVFTHYKFVIAALFRRKVILHYHWLEFQDLKSALGMPYKLLCIWLYTLLGGKLVWTVHNLSPHDKKYVDSHHKLHRWMFKKSDVVLTHTETSKRLVSNYLDQLDNKIFIVPHPGFKSEKLDDEQAAESFITRYGNGRTELKSPVLLAIGAISTYKQLPELAKIISSLDGEFTFIIAGYIKKGHDHLHDELMSIAIDDDRILYHPGFIPDGDYPLFLANADIVLFNYKDILTSGGLHMALPYDVNIIAPAIGELVEFSELSKVSLFSTQEELKSKIKSYISNFSNE